MVKGNSSKCPQGQVTRYSKLTDEQKRQRIEKAVQSKKRKRNDLGQYQLSESYELRTMDNCKHCNAVRLQFEPPCFCCYNGVVKLASTSVPEPLHELFTSQTEEAIEFRRNIRSYNGIFSFTSFGVTHDKVLASSRKGVYTFRAKGQTYHALPSLLPNGKKPTYFQLYFYDTDKEVDNRMNALTNEAFDKGVVEKLIQVMSINPYAQVLRSLQHESLDTRHICIKTDVKLDQRVYNAPTADQVAAIWIEGSDENTPSERDIVVHSSSGKRHKVKHYYSCYDPLQYPLLFPRGEPGWNRNIMKKTTTSANNRSHSSQIIPNSQPFRSVDDILNREEEDVQEENPKKVSCRQYYSYKLQIRPGDRSVLLYSGRLLQQYIVDMYIKLENTRLDYMRNKQVEIRAELYQGIVDIVKKGETRAAMSGKRIVLPQSFVGGPRDMRRRYLDALALVRRFGKPDFFITMTCNPDWKEITDLLHDGQTSQDRPDLTARVFRAKLHDLKDQLFKKEIFGSVAAHVHVIEFQKRGLPHAHLLIILRDKSKITTPEQVDQFVCAEIPDPHEQPDLHEKVAKHMMHGPCGKKNNGNVCMVNNECKSHYPRSFCEETTIGKNSYPIYRRTNNGLTIKVRKADLDNRWVVPYNPYLLSRYNCHINIEVCSGIKAVKYLYKYIYKGHDKVVVHIDEDSNGVRLIDEIKQFQDARWVSAQEACWRIFEFDLNEIYPAVINLQLHLPDKQNVTYWKNQDLRDVLCSTKASKTMLTEFFEFCKNDPQKGQYLYQDFPEQFVWNKKQRCWNPRKLGKVIGRINGANPKEGERYYLRLLLNHVRSPTSFDDLLSFEGVQYRSFKLAAEKRGLLQSDNWISECLADAVTFQMPSTLRRLFAIILVHCDPADVKKLWIDYFEPLSEDLARTEKNKKALEQETLRKIDYILESMGKSIRDYDLPEVNSNVSMAEKGKREILDELAVEIPTEDYSSHNLLNHEQRLAYDDILSHVYENKDQIFFIDGPGGTGKTFLYRALLATIRSAGMIAIATATSGVAAAILPGGRTAHSRFKIPIDLKESGVCNISKQSGIAELVRQAKIIIWDEAPMAKRWAIEALDKSFRDIMGCDKLFGGKIVVFGGDFRQVLPVVPRGTRGETINASLVVSYLWPEMKKLKLTENMRAKQDPAFSEFLLRVGNGDEPTNGEGLIELPEKMVIKYDDVEHCEDSLIDVVFPSLQENAQSVAYVTNRAILASTNGSVDMLNEKLIKKFPGKEWRYASFDQAIDDTNNYYPEEFLNTLTPNGMPSHELVLKENCPIMLLRNLNPSDGLCNGTRMVCRGFESNVIHAEITLGQHAGKQVLLPRIPLQPTEDDSCPFRFKRTQFPVRLCFAMTINKSQGQTIPFVGVYLPQHVFSHGQLYVALSRGTSMSTTKVLVKKELEETTSSCLTKNVVYKEVLDQ